LTAHGFSETECACGCENLLPLSIYNRGWKYLRGHKAASPASVATKAQRVEAKRERSGAVVCAGYTTSLAIAAEDLVAARAREAELMDKFQALTVERDELAGVLGRIAGRITQLEDLCAALEPFIPKAAEVGA